MIFFNHTLDCHQVLKSISIATTKVGYVDKADLAVRMTNDCSLNFAIVAKSSNSAKKTFTALKC